MWLFLQGQLSGSLVQTHEEHLVLVLSLSVVVREYNVWSVLSDSMVGACNVVS